MRLATLENGRPDGTLAVVSTDGTRYLASAGLTLLSAMEDWQAAEPDLLRLAAALEAGGSIPPARARPCRVPGSGSTVPPSVRTASSCRSPSACRRSRATVR
jgi:hypothetical protein